MYYWIRTDNWLDIAGFLLLCLLWAVGGWLIVSHGFRLKSREKLIAGLATGFILFIVLSNLLAQMLPLSLAYWAGAILLCLTGVGLAVFSKDRGWLNLRVWRQWPQLVILGVVTLGFTMILRGLAIFDDYYHMPLISVMASGDIPPHFQLDPALHLPYHYGLQVFAAALVRVGGFYTWSAWDISRAMAFGFVVVLSWLWIRRVTNSPLAAYLGSLLLVFGGGSRWLLLFVPPPVLERMGALLQMDISGRAAGGNLVTVLTNSWPLDGGGPFPFPFAFANGILEPWNMILGATGALWGMTILLLLLLAQRRSASISGMITLGMICASLGLSAENVYAALSVGLALALGLNLLLRARRGLPFTIGSLTPWGIPLAISAVLVLVQGGFISDAFKSVVARLAGQAYPMMTTDFQGFSLRWPPAVPSGHLGPFSLFDLGQIGILLAEAGPALFLMPFVIGCWVRKLRRNNRLPPALALGLSLSFILPVFVRYGLDFDITRLVGAALWLSYVLAVPLVWHWFLQARQGVRFLIGCGFGIAIYAGVVMLAVELIAIPAQQTTNLLEFRENEFAQLYWDRLEKGAQVLDSKPERAVMLFGRASFAAPEVYKRSPVWEKLIANPDPAVVAQAGYAYVYMSSEWWDRLTPAMQVAYKQPCVSLLHTLTFADRAFRKLYRVEACRP